MRIMSRVAAIRRRLPVHPLEILWREHHPVSGYPPGVFAVPEPIPGIAFFPGGYGLWREDLSTPLPPLPVKGVMVLGHDFHSEAGYRASLARGRESAGQPTWRNLVSLLERTGIALSSCFFTNVYLGLREGSETSGTFPGAHDLVFVDHCLHFLRRQILTLQPSMILTLGINVPPLLGRLSLQLADWTLGRGLKFLDTSGPVRYDVRFDGLPVDPCVVVALTHPSLRPACVRHRRFDGASGDDAEVAMVGCALKATARRA